MSPRAGDGDSDAGSTKGLTPAPTFWLRARNLLFCLKALNLLSWLADAGSAKGPPPRQMSPVLRAPSGSFPDGTYEGS